jgi:hypothetical protein
MKDKIKILIITLLCFVSFQPWITWTINAILTFIISLLYITIAVLIFRTKIKSNKIQLVIFIFVSIYFLILNPLVNTAAYFIQATSILFIYIFINESDENKKKIFFKISSLIAYVYIIGIPVFIIVSLYNAFSPIGTIEGRSISVDKFNNYIFYVKSIDSEFGLLNRFNSIFDEPGVVGNISFFILLFNSFKLNNWRYIVILVGGLLSFSLFFYAASIIFIFLIHAKNLKKTLFILFIIFTIGVFAKDNKYIDNYVLKRIAFVDGSFSGNNRTTLAWENNYENFLNSNKTYLGMGASANKENEYENVASYQIIIYKYGYIGFSIFITFFIFIFYHKKAKLISLIVSLAFLSAIYQRPWIFEYYYSIIFLSGIAHLRSIKDKIDNKIKKK